MARLIAFLAAVWTLLATPSSAQDSQPYFPSKENYRVFVLGDALAAGLGVGLFRVSEGDLRLTVDGRYKEDSGLARPEFYDWNDALPKIVESNQIDIAVILIGANDSRDIRSSGLRFVFGTQEWTNAYVSEIDRLVDGLKRAGAAIYWVELPPMRASTYNAALKAISIVQRERMQEKGVRYVEIAKTFLNVDGAYDEMAKDSADAAVRMRDRDGVHFTKAGNNKLGELVLAAIRADIAIADKTADLANPESPVFGQEPAAGVPDTVAPSPAPPTMAAAPDVARPIGQPLTREQALQQTIPGSAAEKLFTLGEAPAAPAGRFDDFSAAEQ